MEKQSHAESCISSLAVKSTLGGIVGFGLGLILVSKGRLPFVLYGAGIGTGISTQQCKPLYERMQTKLTN